MKRKIDERNRKGYFVEIKKDTLYFYCKPISQNFSSHRPPSYGSDWLCVPDGQRKANEDQARHRKNKDPQI